MVRALTVTLILAFSLLPGFASADALTQMIQQDLTALGYSTGGTDGEMNVQTAVAISQFQAENGLDVTGEASPQLAGVIKSKVGQQGQTGQAQPSRRAAARQRGQTQGVPQVDAAAVLQAQQAQLQAAEAQRAQANQARQAQAQAQAQQAQAQQAQMLAALQQIQQSQATGGTVNQDAVRQYYESLGMDSATIEAAMQQQQVQQAQIAQIRAQQAQQAQAAQAQRAQAAQMAAAMQAAQVQGDAGMDPAALQAMMAQMQGGAAMDPSAMQAAQLQAAQMQATQMQAAQMQPAQTSAAQQECLQQMVAEAQVEQQQEDQGSSRGFGGLMRAVQRLGGDELLARVAEAQADLAEANATIADLEAAASC